MPVKNYFPVFHKLKSGAYSYIWTEKCERLLPKHYKSRCLEYMMREPKPVHWIVDTRKYYFDEHGSRIPVQNHPVPVRYPQQCNKGLWGGEGVIVCYIKKIKDPVKDRYEPKRPKIYAPFLVQRSLYSEILDKWFSLPCTNRVMDMIDEVYGLDAYILQNHERDLNSKVGMDIKRNLLIALAKGDFLPNDASKRSRLLKKYEEYIIPLEEAEWIGLSIKEALEKAEKEAKSKQTPLKHIIEEKFIQDLKALVTINQIIDEGKEMKLKSEETKALEVEETRKVAENKEGTPV